MNATSHLPLPMSPDTALCAVINPALSMLPSKMTSDDARVQMIAMALQESGLAAREQHVGPARGLWQFEKGGGVRGVLKFPTTKDYAVMVCNQCGVELTERVV